MNTIAKSVMSNKLSSLGKNIGFDDKNDEKVDTTLSAKEIRKNQEKDATEKAKREVKYAKRNAERERKREDIRSKYGLQKDEKGQSLGRNEAKSSTVNNPQVKEKSEEDKQCVVM